MNRSNFFNFSLALAALSFLPSLVAAPTGTIQDVQHVVVLMQENRSFDHYFGAFHGVRGFDDPNALIFPNGKSDFYQPWNGDYVLPYHITNQCLMDLSHSEINILNAVDGGKWDNWLPAKGTRTMQYYTRDDLPFYYALADSFTICDEYHCSLLGPTYPNRLFLMTGTIDPNGTRGGPIIENDFPPGGLSWTTYPERLQAAGVSWRIYQQSPDYFYFNVLALFTNYWGRLPGDPLHDRFALVPDLLAAFQSDISNNTLPRVSWILPPWTSSEHPSFSPANGQILVKQLLDALASNPAVYNSTVFILTYDEDGGFFDHVPSPIPPPGTPDEFVNGVPTGLGVRVPTILVSPWSRGGYVCSEIFDHTSILRFLERWTGVPEPNISAWRRKVCGDLTSAFDFAHPDTNYPALPLVNSIVCTNGVGIEPPYPQLRPTQETGTNLVRLRPYGPNAFQIADCGTARLGITLTNGGSASTHFMIFANAFRSDGPWQYDVDPSASLTAYFNVGQSAGAYDLTCYGPHRFHRRFAGNINNSCNQLDVTSSVDTSASGVTLAMRNSSATAVTFNITNLFHSGDARSYTVQPGNTAFDTFAIATNSSAGYSLLAAVSSDTSFLRTFTGDGDALAPPAGTNSAPPLTTNSPPAVTNLTAMISGPHFVVAYPGAAGSLTLQYSTTLAPDSWLPVTNPPTASGSNLCVTLPITASRMFFRLRP